MSGNNEYEYVYAIWLRTTIVTSKQTCLPVVYALYNAAAIAMIHIS